MEIVSRPGTTPYLEDNYGLFLSFNIHDVIDAYENNRDPESYLPPWNTLPEPLKEEFMKEWQRQITLVPKMIGGEMKKEFNSEILDTVYARMQRATETHEEMDRNDQYLYLYISRRTLRDLYDMQYRASHENFDKRWHPFASLPSNLRQRLYEKFRVFLLETLDDTDLSEWVEHERQLLNEEEANQREKE